jgi:hypothetical protein
MATFVSCTLFDENGFRTAIEVNIDLIHYVHRSTDYRCTIVSFGSTSIAVTDYPEDIIALSKTGGGEEDIEPDSQI